MSKLEEIIIEIERHTSLFNTDKTLLKPTAKDQTIMPDESERELVAITRQMASSLGRIASSIHTIPRSASEDESSIGCIASEEVDNNGRANGSLEYNLVPQGCHDYLSLTGMPLSAKEEKLITSWIATVGSQIDMAHLNAQADDKISLNSRGSSKSVDFSTGDDINKNTACVKPLGIGFRIAYCQKRLDFAKRLIAEKRYSAAVQVLCEILRECNEELDNDLAAGASTLLAEALFAETSYPGDQNLPVIEDILMYYPNVRTLLATLRIESAEKLLKASDWPRVLEQLRIYRRYKGRQECQGEEQLSILPRAQVRHIEEMIVIALVQTEPWSPEIDLLLNYRLKSNLCLPLEESECHFWLAKCHMENRRLEEAYKSCILASEKRYLDLSNRQSYTSVEVQRIIFLMVLICSVQKHPEKEMWLEMLQPECLFFPEEPIFGNSVHREIMADAFIDILKAHFSFPSLNQNSQRLQPCWPCIKLHLVETKLVSTSFTNKPSLCSDHQKGIRDRFLVTTALHYISISAPSGDWSRLFELDEWTSKIHYSVLFGGLRVGKSPLHFTNYKELETGTTPERFTVVSPILLAAFQGNLAFLRQSFVNLQEALQYQRNLFAYAAAQISLSLPLFCENLSAEQKAAVDFIFSKSTFKELINLLKSTPEILLKILRGGASEDILACLLSQPGCDMNMHVNLGKEPVFQEPLIFQLTAIARIIHQPGICRLITAGSTINRVADSKGLTLLHKAVTLVTTFDDKSKTYKSLNLVPPESGEPDEREWLVRCLIKMGADCTALDACGRTPCHVARHNRAYLSPETYKLLDCGLNTCPPMPTFKTLGQTSITNLALPTLEGNTDLTKKLLVVGDGACGKSMLLL
jgi:hypothetical protein